MALSDGDTAWGLDQQLLAGVVDLLAGANWQRGGGKGTKPKKVPRPGVKDGVEVERLGGMTTYTTDEMRALLDRYSLGK